jgi:hypothetical protein
MDIFEMMAKAGEYKGMKDQKMLTLKKQKEILRRHVEGYSDPANFNLGDLVVLNDVGQKRYRFPIKGQVAMVTTLHPTVIDKDGQPANGCISVVDGDGDVLHFSCDLRYYKKIADLRGV